ncbi:hypothetical protein GCM10007332_16110 [Epilithonimonas arachidiradicis]|uniref:DUF4468 domain-containing protein n=3 Tax=Epilithonimonas arachidiradicis TaxID=1617282 RepID=A0ABQ1X5L9_9FLAO|nr:hypothetical protein GCM10007332_16110 [Epilithonimonas arachidiradicis]
MIMRNGLLNLLFISGLIGIQFCWSQKIERMEFEHSNSIIIGSDIGVTLKPIKNNRKGKVRLIVRKDGEIFVSRITNDRFLEIINAVDQIKRDSLGAQYTYLDPSSSSITIYNDKHDKKVYYTENLTRNSQKSENQKDFWYATKLIIDAARLRMEELIDY